MCEDCRLYVPGDADDVQACELLAAELMQEPVVDVDCLTLLLELRLKWLLFTLLFDWFNDESVDVFDVVAAMLAGVRRELVLVVVVVVVGVVVVVVLWWPPVSPWCWRFDVFRIFDPSFVVVWWWSLLPPALLLCELECVECFCRLFGDGSTWWAFDRVRLAIQLLPFFVWRSGGVSSSLLISIGSKSGNWKGDSRFEWFAFDKFAGSFVSPACRLVILRLDLLSSIVWSTVSTAPLFLPRRFDCCAVSTVTVFHFPSTKRLGFGKYGILFAM